MIPFSLRSRFASTACASLCVALGIGSASSAFAQAFTAADSGWVRVFNGNNFDGFYSRTYNQSGVDAPKVTPPASPYSIEYAGTDTATIRVGSTSTSLQGNIGTLDTTYSHYRLRWEMKHDVVNANYNAGLTYHTDESAIRMQNNWPRSIEFQGKQSEAGSAFSIQQVTFTTRASGTGQGSNYTATGGSVVQACEYGCNGRWYKGSPLIQPYEAATPTVTRWMRFHLVVRGADSAIHIVNDTTVMRLWNIRIFNDSTKATGSTSSGSASASNKTPNQPWDHGGLGWQSEGALVRYRRLEVMRMPASTPMNEHFLHRLFLNRDSVWSPFGYKNQPIQWRSIGTLPFVRIEYRDLDVNGGVAGNWQAIADSAPNTGAYVWNNWASKIASTFPPRIRVRVSGSDWVWGDSTDIRIEYGDVGIRSAWIRGDFSLSMPGQGMILANLASGSRIEIRDAGGSLVRTLTLDGNLSWDRLDARGQRVPPGMYFLRALHEGVAYRAGRALVL
jgi:hypothetical protein